MQCPAPAPELVVEKTVEKEPVAPKKEEPKAEAPKKEEPKGKMHLNSMYHTLQPTVKT
jgi:hypothetical protein